MKFSKSKLKSKFESQFSMSEYVTRPLSIYFAQTRIRITDSVVEFVVKSGQAHYKSGKDDYIQ
jgi:hypothetical protein